MHPFSNFLFEAHDTRARGRALCLVLKFKVRLSKSSLDRQRILMLVEKHRALECGDIFGLSGEKERICDRCRYFLRAQIFVEKFKKS